LENIVSTYTTAQVKTCLSRRQAKTTEIAAVYCVRNCIAL